MLSGTTRRLIFRGPTTSDVNDHAFEAEANEKAHSGKIPLPSEPDKIQSFFAFASAVYGMEVYECKEDIFSAD